MDVIALGIALAAVVGAARPANARRSFGYGRIEMLGALANGALLLAATAFIAYEAILRFQHPALPHGGLMSAVAAIALVVNVGVGLLLMRDGKHDLNVRAALYHVGGDALGSAAVLVGGAVIVATRVAWIDPALSLFVACVIVLGVWRILADASEVLLEAVPRDVNPNAVARDMAAVPGVLSVHDLHVWTIGSGRRALSAHVRLDDRRLSEASVIGRLVRDRVAATYGISHATLQMECDSCGPEDSIICSSLGAPKGPGEATLSP